MSKKQKKMLQQHIVSDEAPLVSDIHFGAVKKYENRHRMSLQAQAANAPYAGTAAWKHIDHKITAGPNLGGKPNAVKAKIRAFVVENGPMTGATLVTRLFHEVVFENNHNSEYVKGGRPTYAWIEDYVSGCLRSNSQVLALVEGE